MPSTPEYKAFNRNLLGKPTSSNKDSQELYDGILYDFSMGYYTHLSMNPFSSTEYFSVESECVHPFSFDNIGWKYGYNKLEQILPLDVYLNLPAAFVDPVISGIVRGKTERDVRDEPTGEEKEPTQEEIEREVTKHLSRNQ